MPLPDGRMQPDHEGRPAIDDADPAEGRTIALLKRAGSGRPSGISGRAVCDAEKALDRLG